MYPWGITRTLSQGCTTVSSLLFPCLYIHSFPYLLLFKAQSSPPFCNPMDCSMPCFPVIHYLSELAQTHVHWIGDAIQISHPLLSPQHHCSKASILWCSAFFIVQLSHPYMTTGKTIALTIWTFFSKVMSLLFNMVSRFVIALLPRRKCLLILWLQSPSTVILDPNKIKAVHFFPIYLPWSDGTGCHDLTFLNVES